MEVIKSLIKKELNSEEGLGTCCQVCHYTPGVKFAREGGDLGGCPTTFQHASSLSRRKVGGYNSRSTAKQGYTPDKREVCYNYIPALGGLQPRPFSLGVHLESLQVRV